MLRILICVLFLSTSLLGYDLPAKSKFNIDPDILEGLKRNLSQPIVAPVRPIFFEGEEILVDILVPIKTTKDSIKSYIAKNWFFSLRAELRVFCGSQEFTDSIYNTGCDVGSYQGLGYVIPGENREYVINHHNHLLAGDYWGVLDIGYFSDAFQFKVMPLPDSLMCMQELHEAIHAYPHKDYEFGHSSGITQDKLEYAKLLISLPRGAPLRMEGLRACTGSLSRAVCRGHIVADTTIVLRALQEFLNEPRTHSQDAFYAIMGYFDHDYSRETEILQLANELGADDLAKILKDEFEHYKAKNH